MKEKTKEILKKLAICTAGYGMMSDNVMFPLLNAIYSEYPESSTFIRNFAVSGAGIASIIFGILTGFLMKKVNKKKILVWGTIIFAVGGVMGAFSKSMEFLAFTRVIDAASDGILTAVTASMIVDLWKSKEEQTEMISWYNLASCIFGIIMSISAGYAALVNWRYAFYVNAISIIATILCIFFVPDDMPSEEEEKPEERLEIPEQQAKILPGWVLALALLSYSIVQTCNYMPSFLIDLIVGEKNIGNSVLSGYLTSVLTIAGILAFLSSAPVFNRIRNKYWFMVMCGVMITADLLIYGTTTSRFLIGVAHFLNGFFGSWLLVFFEMFIAEHAPEATKDIWLSVTTSIIYLDGLIAVYIPDLVNLFVPGVSVSMSATITGGLIGLIALIYVVISLRNQKETA